MSRRHALTAPVLPLPPLHGPGAAPPPGPARPAPTLPRPSLLPEPGLPAMTSRPPPESCLPAMTLRPSLLPEPGRPTAPRPSPPESNRPIAPRPSLLPAIDPHATLVLPDALRPGGPEAATIERPTGGPGHVAATARDRAPPGAPRRPTFDELASPDITMMQLAAVPGRARPTHAGPRRTTRPAVDSRAYFLLNLCLGLLIVGALAMLLGRGREAPPAAEDHVAR